MAAPPAPTQMVDWDFVVLKEDFSRYLVEDGTILKVKVVVRKIVKTLTLNPQGYPVGYGMDTVNAVAAIVPPQLKREPSKEPWDPRKDIGEEMKFEVQEEKWQEYMTHDGYRVLVKPVVVKIIKYQKYNEFGEPIYMATTQQITNVEKMATTARI